MVRQKSHKANRAQKNRRKRDKAAEFGGGKDFAKKREEELLRSRGAYDACGYSTQRSQAHRVERHRFGRKLNQGALDMLEDGRRPPCGNLPEVKEYSFGEGSEIWMLVAKKLVEEVEAD